jgi:small ligand-binding sensory domain FIST
VVLRDAGAQVIVTQACHPVTQALEVTRSRGNWIYGIDGRPALDVYREAAMGPLSQDLRRAKRFLMFAIPQDASPDAAEFSVRHVVGFDEQRGAISLPQPVSVGSTVRLALLDPDAARSDLGRSLEQGPAAPDFGLYFNCRARGESLFGVSGMEAGYLERHFGKVPMVGTFGAFQLAPSSGPSQDTQLLTYAGVLALAGR